jgi:hypothetical protein
MTRQALVWVEDPSKRGVFNQRAAPPQATHGAEAGVARQRSSSAPFFTGTGGSIGTAICTLEPMLFLTRRPPAFTRPDTKGFTEIRQHVVASLGTCWIVLFR